MLTLLFSTDVKFMNTFRKALSILIHTKRLNHTLATDLQYVMVIF